MPAVEGEAVVQELHFLDSTDRCQGEAVIGKMRFLNRDRQQLLRVVRRLPITEVYQNVSRSRAGVGQAPREETAGNISEVGSCDWLWGFETYTAG